MIHVKCLMMEKISNPACKVIWPAKYNFLGKSQNDCKISMTQNINAAKPSYKQCNKTYQ